MNKDCFWKISAPPGHTIQATFDDLNTESSLSGTCYDYVQIFDGFLQNDKPLGLDKYCGRRVPNTLLISSGNKMLVRFYSDSQNPKRGFQLTWKTTQQGVKKG